MKEVILDTETTGLDVKDGHRIVEIGCLEIDNFVLTSNKFHCYLNPERKVSDQAFKVHGYSDTFLASQKRFSEIADEFLDFIKDKKIIIHNASFDLGFLNGELKVIGKDLIEKKQVVDSLEIARNKFPGTSNSLDALCKRFNIDLSKRTKHNALLDCELLREVYINLLGAKEPKFNLSSSSDEQNVIHNTTYNKQVLDISDTEIKLHQDFLKKELKKNFY